MFVVVVVVVVVVTDSLKISDYHIAIPTQLSKCAKYLWQFTYILPRAFYTVPFDTNILLREISHFV